MTLTIVVPLVGRYPSVNHLGRDGRRFGRKSEAYRALFQRTLEAAQAAMAKDGWQTVTTECAVTVTLYVADRRRRDASNLGKCELDALTEAGVWDDDCRANPVTLQIKREAGCEPFVHIAVQVSQWRSLTTRETIEAARPVLRRMAERQVERAAKSARSTVDAVAHERRITPLSLPPWRPGDPIPVGYAVCGGKLVTIEFATDLLSKARK